VHGTGLKRGCVFEELMGLFFGDLNSLGKLRINERKVKGEKG